jgi:hypothetical protein
MNMAEQYTPKNAIDLSAIGEGLFKNITPVLPSQPVDLDNGDRVMGIYTKMALLQYGLK